LKQTIYVFLVLLLATTACNQTKPNAVVVNNTVNVQTDSAFIQTVTFPSLDSLTVTATIYHAGQNLPVMVLCHQANYSRGEYKETAPLFNKLGYNCIAIDQRSGKAINDVENQTAKAANAKNLPTEYIDAEQDIIAAVNYAHNLYGRNVTLMGSSYSASLVLKIAAENPKVDAVIAFSPGEYFGNDLNVLATVKSLDKPVFITSSKNEVEDCKLLFDAIPSSNKTQFIPQTHGYHGSKALWPANSSSKEYWAAVKSFLSK
jgi:dienelactone hydrolase